MVKVSVVLPVYNAERHLVGALNNIAEQSFRDFEVILVDDGSDQPVGNIAETVEGLSDITVKSLRLEHNAGTAAARNFGIENAVGDYIAFYDVDDRWHADKLQKQYDVISNNKNIVLLGCQANWKNKGNNVGLLIKNISKKTADISKELFWNAFIATPCAVVAKSALDIHRFDETLRVAEDRDLWLYLSHMGEVAVICEPLVDINVQPDSLMAKSGLLARMSILEVIYKHVELQRHRLSVRERRKAMGRAHFDVGEVMAIYGHHYWQGLGHLTKAAWFGFRPWQCLRHGLLSAPLLKWIRNK